MTRQAADLKNGGLRYLLLATMLEVFREQLREATVGSHRQSLPVREPFVRDKPTVNQKAIDRGLYHDAMYCSPT